MFSDACRPLKILVVILFLALVSLDSFLGRFSFSPWLEEMREQSASLEGRLIPLSYVAVVAGTNETATLSDGFTQWEFRASGGAERLPVGETVTAMVLFEKGGTPRIISWQQERHRISKHVISLLPLFFLIYVFAKRYRLDPRRILLVCQNNPPPPGDGPPGSGGTTENA
jgi:hypothetical protein